MEGEYESFEQDKNTKVGKIEERLERDKSKFQSEKYGTVRARDEKKEGERERR